ncbi:trehalose-phosphatase [Pontibacter populi]|uniref:Trehalose 6-phosphate phosphatase n=1 Tax=Pontibacter populi TaxID=890055 RepID=A0ABV1RUZ4_9BACT
MEDNLDTALRQKHIKALILDMDGVVTQTARLHAQAWKRMFDAYLQQRGKRENKTYYPLTIATDYRKYIDGIPRYDGVRNFLASRTIVLPEGEPTDEPGKETIAGLGNLKNIYFKELLTTIGAEAYPDTIAWLTQQRAKGMRTAIISASKNSKTILASAGVKGLFDAVVDGIVAVELGLKGKPAPDIFMEAARQLDVQPDEAAVFEDALAGVEAGRAGNFALIVGVDRTNDGNALKQHGADLVIRNFPTDKETMTNPSGTKLQKREASELPSILPHINKLLDSKTPAVFLDYDGCLTPIVKQPEMAVLSPEMREVLEHLSRVCTVAIVSGRDRRNVAQLVNLENLFYAGSHGFDISGPDGMHIEPGGAAEALPALDEADVILKEKLKDVEGSIVERKRYAIAVHFRNVADEQVAIVDQAVEDVLILFPQLKKGLGKKIYELKPNLNWHKGKAVLWLMDTLHLNRSDILPIYIGDDITDEDAFASLQGTGTGILVGAHDDKTAASYSLKDVDEVRIFLQKLTDVVNSRRDA